MSSRTKTESNRRNAAHSTGPRTAAGKAISSRNALKSGIYANAMLIPGEDREQLDQLTAEYYARFRPSDPERRALVDILIHSEWLLRRFRRVESELWNYRAAEERKFGGVHFKYRAGQLYTQCVETLGRLQRRIDSTQRTYMRVLRELRLPPAPDAEAPVPEPPPEHERQPEVVEMPSPSHPVGFVPPPAASAPLLPPTAPAPSAPARTPLSAMSDPAPSPGSCTAPEAASPAKY